MNDFPTTFDFLKRESIRLETFKNVWSYYFIRPEDLAAAGFYNIDVGDRVN